MDSETLAAVFDSEAARHDEIAIKARNVAAYHEASAAYMIRDFCRRMADVLRENDGPARYGEPVTEDGS